MALTDSGNRRATPPVVPAMKAISCAITAAVLTLTLAACGEQGDRADDPAGTPSAGPPACPPAPEEGESDPLDEPDPQAGDTVPEGATSVRLCQGPGNPVEGAGDLVTTDVDSLVATVNGLETTEEPEMCTMDMGPGFRLVFGYDDGSTFVVSGKSYGCRTLVVGSTYRTPAPEALSAFRALAG